MTQKKTLATEKNPRSVAASLESLLQQEDKGKKECLFPVEVNDEKKSALTNFEVNHIANKGIGFGLKVRIAQLCIGKAFLTSSYWKKGEQPLPI